VQASRPAIRKSPTSFVIINRKKEKKTISPGARSIGARHQGDSKPVTRKDGWVGQRPIVRTVAVRWGQGIGRGPLERGVTIVSSAGSERIAFGGNGACASGEDVAKKRGEGKKKCRVLERFADLDFGGRCSGYRRAPERPLHHHVMTGLKRNGRIDQPGIAGRVF